MGGALVATPLYNKYQLWRIMFKSIFILSIVILLSGCSSTYIIDKNDSYKNKDIFNFLSKKYESLVQLTDSTEYSTNTIYIKNDTLYFTRNGLESISLDKVSTIKLRDYIDGLFDGVLLGFPVGIGAMVILINADDNSGGMVPLIVAGVSYIATVVVNLIFSHNKTFIFKRDINNTFSIVK